MFVKFQMPADATVLYAHNVKYGFVKEDRLIKNGVKTETPRAAGFIFIYGEINAKDAKQCAIFYESTSSYNYDDKPVILFHYNHSYAEAVKLEDKEVTKDGSENSSTTENGEGVPGGNESPDAEVPDGDKAVEEVPESGSSTNS